MQNGRKSSSYLAIRRIRETLHYVQFILFFDEMAAAIDDV